MKRAVSMVPVLLLLLLGCRENPAAPGEEAVASAEDVSPLFALEMDPGTCAVLPTGLISWWSGEGSANDLVGVNDGILVNGASFSPGIVGQAFWFDGIDDFVDLGMYQNTNELTIEAWIYSNGFAGRYWRDILVLARSQKRNLIVGNASGTGRLSAYPDVYGTTVLLTGQWYHVAYTHDGSTGTIFVNGAPDGSKDYTIPAAIVSLATLGNWPPNLEHWNGLIDEPSVYDRALSASEIMSIYEAGSAGKCTGLPPDEAIQAIDTDVDGFETDGSITNSGIAESLQAFLSQAEDAIERGDDTAAIKSLGKFIDHVEKRVESEHIDADAGQTLIDAAQAVIDQLSA